jgi:hypothetical protein
MTQPIIPDDAFLSNENSNNNQGIIIPDDAYTSPSSNNNHNIGHKIDNKTSYLQSLVDAAGKGVQQGLDDITSTIAKGLTKIAPYVGLPELKTSDVQALYDKNLASYNADSDTNAHPIASGLGRLGGNLFATAPLGAVGAGSGAVTSMGRIAQSAASGALQGGLMGAITNQPGNNDVLNTSGAKLGAAFGGTLGAGASALMGNYAKNLSNYGDFKDSLSQVGYKGPIFATDVPGNQGVYNSIKESVVNGAISKLPLVRNLPMIGTQSARQAQLDGIENVLKTMADKYTSIDKTMSLNQFKNAILKAKSSADETIGLVSSDFRNILNDLGMNSHNMKTAVPLAKDLLQNDNKVLSNQAVNALNSINDYMTTNSLLGSKEAIGLKQRIWNEYERLAGDRVDTAAYNASQKLNDLYHNINGDILNSVSASPVAIESFNRFNTVTSGIKTLWDPKNSKVLASAMRDINNDATGMVNFFNKLKNNSLAPQAYDKYSKMIGSEGMGAVQDQVLNNIFKSSIRPNGSINITKLLSSINNSPENLVNTDIKNSLQGLSYLAQKTMQGMSAGKVNSILETAGGAALGAATYLNPAVQGLVASGSAIGAITAHAPIKNFLLGINKTIGVNEPLSQYLINKASKYINRAGISMILDNEGNVQINKRDLGDK